MDEHWQALREKEYSGNQELGPSFQFPLPVTMNNLTVPGPVNSPALGWAIESLGERIIVDNKRGGKLQTQQLLPSNLYLSNDCKMLMFLIMWSH